MKNNGKKVQKTTKKFQTNENKKTKRLSLMALIQPKFYVQQKKRQMDSMSRGKDTIVLGACYGTADPQLEAS